MADSSLPERAPEPDRLPQTSLEKEIPSALAKALEDARTTSTDETFLSLMAVSWKFGNEMYLDDQSRRLMLSALSGAQPVSWECRRVCMRFDEHVGPGQSRNSVITRALSAMDLACSSLPLRFNTAITPDFHNAVAALRDSAATAPSTGPTPARSDHDHRNNHRVLTLDLENWTWLELPEKGNCNALTLQDHHPVFAEYGIAGGAIAERITGSYMAISKSCYQQIAPCVAYLFPASSGYCERWKRGLAQEENPRDVFHQLVAAPEEYTATKKIEPLDRNTYPTIVTVVFPMQTFAKCSHQNAKTFYEVFTALLALRRIVRLELVNCSQISWNNIIYSKMASFKKLTYLDLYGCNQLTFRELVTRRFAIRYLPFVIDLVPSEPSYHHHWNGDLERHAWRLALRWLIELPLLFADLLRLFNAESLFFRHFMVQFHGLSYYTQAQPEVFHGLLDFSTVFRDLKIDYRKINNNPVTPVFTPDDVLDQIFMAVAKHAMEHPSATYNHRGCDAQARDFYYGNLLKKHHWHVVNLAAKAGWVIARKGPKKGVCTDRNIPAGRERLRSILCACCRKEMTIYCFTDSQRTRVGHKCIYCQVTKRFEDDFENLPRYMAKRKPEMWSEASGDWFKYTRGNLGRVRFVCSEDEFKAWLAGEGRKAWRTEADNGHERRKLG